MDLRQVFAANLWRLGHEKGLSQEALALEADINRSCRSFRSSAGICGDLWRPGPLGIVDNVRHAVIEGRSPPWDSCPSARGLSTPFATLSKLGRAALVRLFFGG
jgi:hypothetical protein